MRTGAVVLEQVHCRVSQVLQVQRQATVSHRAVHAASDSPEPTAAARVATTGGSLKAGGVLQGTRRAVSVLTRHRTPAC